jgi:hypothetical protein
MCVCEKTITHVPDHAHVCPTLRRAGANDRHHELVKRFAALAREAGCTVTVESRINGADRNSHKPDLLIRGTQGSYMADVTITHPTAPFYSKRNKEGKPAYAAMEAGGRKRTKYQQLAKVQKYKFAALSFESYGTSHPDVARLLSWLSKEAASVGLHPAEWKSRAARELSFALQIGNARLAISHYRLLLGERVAGR